MSRGIIFLVRFNSYRHIEIIIIYWRINNMPENNTNNNPNSSVTNDPVEIRKVLIDYLNKSCPDELLKQFCNLVIHTNDFLTTIMNLKESEKIPEKDRSDYILRSMDCVNIISRFVAMVGSGASPSTVSSYTDQTPIQDDNTVKSAKSAPSIAEMYDISEEKLDKLTVKDIIKEELENWGISENTYGHRALMILADMEYDANKKPNDIILEIATKLGKPMSSTHAALQNIVNRANFRNSKYLSLFTNMPRGTITKEMIISEFYDFCKK